MVTNKGAITKVGFGKILHKKSVILSLERPKITLFSNFPKVLLCILTVGKHFCYSHFIY